MILILDDHPIARQGLEAIIKMYKPQEDIVQAGTVREAMSIMETQKPDMVFVDINLGQESGFDFLEWLRPEKKEVKVFMITSSSSESDFLHARALGVDAYLLKDAFIDDIVYSLKVIERGGKFYSSDLIAQMGQVSEEEKLLDTLTKRELEVLFFLNQGHSNAKIGEELFVSEGTVKKHISNLLGKLGLENRMEAGLFSSRNSEKLELMVKFGEETIREFSG
ncbi:MAG: response regulator transcription factor [Filifactor alocis]|nr:response regulator transcription factor [Filifactor alocis]